MNNICFIILRNINSVKTNLYWILCYKSIRKIYGNDPKIIIIDDNSKKEFINNKFEKDLINAEIIESEFPKRGEILPYYYFLKIQEKYNFDDTNFYENAVILHDSIFIQQFIDFKLYKDKNINFLWIFNHDWDDPINEIKLLNNCISKESNYLSEIIHKNYFNKNKWNGCFGAMSIIKYSFLKKLQEKYNIFSLLNYIDSRQKRMYFERIFGFLCCIENNTNLNKSISIFGNIHNYIKWGLTFEEYINNLNTFKKYKIIKIWSGR